MCHAQEVLSISLNGVTHLVRDEKDRERGKITAGRERDSERKTKSKVKLSKYREKGEAGKWEAFVWWSSTVGPPDVRTDPRSVPLSSDKTSNPTY